MSALGQSGHWWVSAQFNPLVAYWNGRAVLRPRQQSMRAGAPKTKEHAMADAPTNSRHANRSSPSLGDMCLVKTRDHQFIISCSQFGRDSKF
jgi:hypothetical protein